MTSGQYITTAIAGVKVELQPRFGTHEGAVLHMLPGGVQNPEGFGQELLDVYASTAQGKGVQRGGHYHLKLDELFFTVAGTALWILSDFREDSPTYQKTIGLILGVDRPQEKYDVHTYVVEDGSLPRLRVPHGVYHTFIPLTDERVTTICLGSTPYVKEDYRYPELAVVPGAKELLDRVGLALTSESAGT